MTRGQDVVQQPACRARNIGGAADGRTPRTCPGPGVRRCRICAAGPHVFGAPGAPEVMTATHKTHDNDGGKCHGDGLVSGPGSNSSRSLRRYANSVAPEDGRRGKAEYYMGGSIRRRWGSPGAGPLPHRASLITPPTPLPALPHRAGRDSVRKIGGRRTRRD